MLGENGWPQTPDWSLPQREALTSTTADMKPLAEQESDGRGTD